MPSKHNQQSYIACSSRCPNISEQIAMSILHEATQSGWSLPLTGTGECCDRTSEQHRYKAHNDEEAWASYEFITL